MERAMSLREAARFDYQTGQRNKLTMWGMVSADRAARKVSRRAKWQPPLWKGRNKAKGQYYA